jgi:hypothetical protein
MNYKIIYTMEQTTIFKKFETIGTTKDAAMKESGLNLRVDATQAYKKWAKENAVTEESQKAWMKEYLAKKKFTMPNDGAYIVLQTAVTDSRERPYKVEKPKYENRSHSPEKFYVLRDATGNEVGRTKTSKDAEAKGKEFVVDFKEDITINYEWAPKEKNSLYATIKYTPSKGTQPCKLLVFGYQVMD